jgi:hypothetical protein
MNAVYVSLKSIFEPGTGELSTKCAVVDILLRPSGDIVVTEMAGANYYWQITSAVKVAPGGVKAIRLGLCIFSTTETACY